MELGLLWSLLTATAASFALGFLWYGPLFGKPWMAAMGWASLTPEQLKVKQQGAMPGYLASLGGNLVATFLLWILYGWAVEGASYSGVPLGMAIALAGWVAFYVPGTLASRFFEGANPALGYIDGGYWVVIALVEGAAVGFFHP